MEKEDRASEALEFSVNLSNGFDFLIFGFIRSALTLYGSWQSTLRTPGKDPGYKGLTLELKQTATS